MPRIKRGATDLCGVIAIDKPAGISSHDVVARMRRITGEGRIGHAGTLDPEATGLLLVCIGPATRLSDHIMAKHKSYLAELRFGSATDTDDAAGRVIATAPVPARVADADYAASVLERFVGEQLQLPPQYSAIKKDGVKAYELARKGEVASLSARAISVEALKLLASGADFWLIEARVSKGTYIRSLARDLGEAVGSKAHLHNLRRVSSGMVDIEQAHSLEELEGLSKAELKVMFLDPVHELGIDMSGIGEGLRSAITSN